MKLAGLLTTICLVFGSLSLSAQDLHNTLYDYAPLSVNPANAGNFLGSYRVGGIYRDQFSVLGTGTEGGTLNTQDFETPMFYVDAPLPFIIGKGHWIGAGLHFQTDKSGTLNQETTLFGLAASFNYAINAKKNTYFTIGLQGAMRSRSFSGLDNASTEQSILSSTSPLDDAALTMFGQGGAGAQNTPGADGLVINAGVKFRTNIDKKTHFHIGLAALNITRPNQSLDNPDSDSIDFRLPLRVNIHAGLRRQINKKWTLNPTLFVSTIGNQNQAAVQVWGEYLFNEEKEIDFRIGLGHRLGRDVQPLIGINYGPLRVAGSYDVRLGSLGKAINNRGGWELGVSYVGIIFKKVDVPKVIFCPQF